MKEMTWTLAYFSPTGGTCKIARAIAAGSGCRCVELDLTDPHFAVPQAGSDLLLTVVPVFGGRVPQICLQRLAMLQGKSKYAAAVVVYGNRAFDDALLELKDFLEQKGFLVIAAAAFVAEHSLVRTIAAGRPDESDRKIAEQFGKRIAGKWLKSEPQVILHVPGNNPYCEQKPARFHPLADESCTRCGLCEERCPTEAILREDPCRLIENRCINCMRCVEVCPVHARRLPSAFVSGAKTMLEEKAAIYRMPEIFLE